ncbi:hypothetical protein [Flavobacterium panacagri]|uniref:hypothetical protein n=1 Tax=Flavobacterium panacagri TaxID=3034146 RepID=UPI0025A54D18|nr:hypothetical protein [Flavobacterium panacagri]
MALSEEEQVLIQIVNYHKKFRENFLQDDEELRFTLSDNYDDLDDNYVSVNTPYDASIIMGTVRDYCAYIDNKYHLKDNKKYKDHYKSNFHIQLVNIKPLGFLNINMLYEDDDYLEKNNLSNLFKTELKFTFVSSIINERKINLVPTNEFTKKTDIYIQVKDRFEAYTKMQRIVEYLRGVDNNYYFKDERNTSEKGGFLYVEVVKVKTITILD